MSEDIVKRGFGVLIATCCFLIACKSPPAVEAPKIDAPPVVEAPKTYHDIEVICGNASAKVAGKHIVSVELAREPATKKKLVVEMKLDEDGIATVNSVIRKNRGKELSIVIPARIVLVGRMDREIEDGTVRVSSYSQAVADELRGLLIKE